MLKAQSEMTLSELAVRVRWFEELAALYEHNAMPDTAEKNRAAAAQYRTEMERRPDTAE